MDFLLGIASFLIVLIPLVILHELGHFIAAKLVGITVLEFGIGFPPRAKVLFQKGDTIYTLNWLPIGGFVRPYGEDFVSPKNEQELAGDRQEIAERGIKNPKSVFQAGPWERIAFMGAGPLMNFIVAWLLFVFVALVGQPFQRADVTIYDVAPGSPAAAAQLEPGDVILSINGEEVESADQFTDRINNNLGEPVSLVVERDGEQLNMTLTDTDVAASDVVRAYVTSVEDDMPAAEAGFEAGDVIVAVDGIEITSLTQLQNYTADHEGETMQVTVLRGGDRLTIPVAPTPDSNGTVRIGIGIAELRPAAIGLTAVNQDTEVYTRTLPLGEAIQTATDEFVEIPTLMYETIRDVINGSISPEAARPVSPVGIGQIGAPILEQSLDEGTMYPIVSFAALISIALAITNLLPIPGLDGGRILLVVIELIRGKPMSPEREGIIHLVGLLFLLGLIAITLINDIVNPIDLGNLR